MSLGRASPAGVTFVTSARRKTPCKSQLDNARVVDQRETVPRKAWYKTLDFHLDTISLIKKVQHEGPYVIGGYSYGRSVTLHDCQVGKAGRRYCTPHPVRSHLHPIMA
ncbi:hypothetical protein BKA82DRAFT_292399 [Pisolithus tinctorius]|uniref:Uncharacterized protein n=1 Tax=Pisolithus tinctorius Marx 270 TaxID=870435 RepID=A0A0C3JEG3_PISTI|nr:hypothetical protein BKA82DRAFT_292399 [Pisolithus tinctorius]KIN96011.1 hypothetical protein M404DRAFT_292399 [Pisolithus tinctorius Marx 270]